MFDLRSFEFLQSDLGMHQSWLMSWFHSNGFPLESWIDLNQYFQMPIEWWDESNQFPGNALGSWVELIHFPRRCYLSLEFKKRHYLNRISSFGLKVTLAPPPGGGVPWSEILEGRRPRNYEFRREFSEYIPLKKSNIFETKWPKSEEKLEFGVR